MPSRVYSIKASSRREYASVFWFGELPGSMKCFQFTYNIHTNTHSEWYRGETEKNVEEWKTIVPKQLHPNLKMHYYGVYCTRCMCGWIMKWPYVYMRQNSKSNRNTEQKRPYPYSGSTAYDELLCACMDGCISMSIVCCVVYKPYIVGASTVICYTV